MNRVVFTRSSILAASASLIVLSSLAHGYDQVIDFSSPPTLSTTQAPGAWYTDRYAPAGFQLETLGGNSRLKLSISSADGAQLRPGSFSSTFYNTQGRKLDLPSGAYAVEGKLFVSSDWTAPTARRRSDIWATAFDSSNGVSAYPIIGIANVDGTAVIRYWDLVAGWAVSPLPVTGDTWNTLGIKLENGNVVYTANGTTVATIAAPGSARLGDLMIQGYNFNDSALGAQQSSDSYDVYWDDVSYAFTRVYNSTDDLAFPSLTAALAAGTTGAGDVIELNAGTYSEGSINVNKAVTIKGPNAGIAGSSLTRGPEARLSNTSLNLTAAAVLDGVEVFRNDSATGDAVLIQAAAEVKNSVIRRNGSTAGVIVRGITTANVAGVTISGNLFTGDPSGGFFSGHKSWQSGIYSNGGATNITGNTFENCRSALNLDDFNASVVVSGNSFKSSGTYLSFGGVSPTAGSYTIAGNNFDIDFGNPASLPSTLFNNSNVATSFRVDATGNTFGGVATAALTDSQKFALEARMYHRGRSNRNGVIDYVADEQVVVAGTTIASAIDAAGTGDSVLVGPGTFSEDVVVNKSVVFQGAGAGVTTLSGPIGGGGATVSIAASNVTVDGFTITRAGNNTTDWNNPNLNSGGVTIQGLALSGAVISNNEIVGNRTGIDINHSNGHTVRNNVVANNRTGLIFRNQTDNLTVEENSITGNWTAGIVFLDASSGTNSPLQQAAGSEFNNNNISGNWYGQVVDRQSGGSLPAPGSSMKNFEGNWFGTTSPVVSTANSAEPGYAAQIPVAFGGTATAPGGQPDIAGPASASIDFAPLLALGTDTDVETAPGRGTYGFQGNTSETVDAVLDDTTITTPETYEDLYIPAGTTVTVPPGSSLTAGTFNMGTGSTLVVNEGSFTIGDSTISGTFTIFNSFGSFNIDDDTTFTVGQSLALVTDIHVAAGKTITVNGGGELILDGCVINGQTPGGDFNINVANNGLLTLARSVVTDANIDVNTATASVPANLKSKIYDNSFTSSDIEASADAAVYHNLFDAATNGAANTDATTAFDAVDGWSNVTDAADLLNRFTLNFAAPGDTTRTLDGEGNLFVQPADAVVLKVDVGNLSPNTIVGADALLGYNSNRLTLVSGNPAVTPAAGWQVLVDNDSVSAPLGLIDSALGLNFTSPGDDGISGPANIANVNFTAGSPGQSLGFFRVQTNRQFDELGELVKDTRLTKSSGGVTSYLSPFTANTGELVVDDADPTIDTGSVTGVQDQDSSASPVNVLDSANRVFRTGDVVTIEFEAEDAGLAGLDAADVENDLVFTANNGITVLDADDYTVVASENSGVVTYTVTLSVPTTATVGTYSLTASVIDRSGNSSGSTALGSFIIANEVNATVQIQGFVGTSRDVVFKATDSSGTVLKTWTKTVNGVVGGIGSVNLDDVPAGTVAISAKTAWSLRSKKAVSFSSEGLASVTMIGLADKLKGGDLNGDNVVNTLDYGVLRFHYNSTNAGTRTVADITGDAAGEVNLTDFNVMQLNFYTVGSAQ